MAIITVILSVLILTMTVLLGDRRVKNELIRNSTCNLERKTTARPGAKMEEPCEIKA